MKKKLRAGVIGSGCIANSAHLPALDNLRSKELVEIVAVADYRKEAAQETSERFNVPHWYEDPQKMLNEIPLDFVAICTPNLSHKDLSIAALKAGVHVVCEKPLALTYLDAKEMFQTADQYNKMLICSQTTRWRHNIEFAQDAIKEGDIGKIYFADVSIKRRYGIPTWGTFHMIEENGGGPFCDLGVHYLDALLWMTGNPRVEAVSGKMFDYIAKQGKDVLRDIKDSGAYLGFFTPRPYDHKEFNVEDSAVGMVRLEGNFAVNFCFTWAIHLPSARRFIVCGENGSVDIDGHMLYKNTGRYQSDIKLKTFDNRPYESKVFEGHWYMYEHLLDVFNGEAECRVKPKETLNMVSAIESFYKSALENREVATNELEGYDL
ncbi:MAG: Gfo/Idh/MocA family oxidoreductase [Oscillospiraceae bacterium]|nr:Gfo/Idh/MocA family oxidoreductase [Oscillospiraceae bacterium]